ncbi:hypothetical protein DRO32_03150 [Candidatus Bathyarchaeota archaeon]|nr:MAG: hypothetical protein DRO32_03150 [Candidatus Bathyarchaeota archaeon]
MTYEELLRAWKAEREAPGLSRLEEDFYRRAAELIGRLRARLRMPDTGARRTRRASVELENVEKMVKDIFERRLEKAVGALMSGEGLELDKLTPEEREIFSSLEAAFASSRRFLEGILRGEVRGPAEGGRPGPTGRAEGPKMMLIRILAEVPAIVGADMRTHGPFKPGDVAFIPTENALALVRKGLAAEVEVA